MTELTEVLCCHNTFTTIYKDQKLQGQETVQKQQQSQDLQCPAIIIHCNVT